MTFLLVLGILTLVVGGAILFIAGAQLTFFVRALSGQHSFIGWFLLAGGAFLFWLAYYLSPLAISVKVIA